MDKSELDKDVLLKQAEKNLREAYSLWKTGNKEESCKIASRVAPLFEKHGVWIQCVQARNIVGYYYMHPENVSNVVEVERYLNDTLSHAEKYIKPHYQELMRAYSNLGYWYAQIMRKPIKAKSYLKSALDLSIQVNGLVSRPSISNLNNLAFVHRINEDPQMALIYAEKAVQALEQLNQSDKSKPNTRTQVIYYANLSSFYADMGKKEKAKECLNHILRKYNEEDLRENQLFDVIANSYYKQNQLEEALKYAKKNLDLQLQISDAPTMVLVYAYSEIGKMFMAKKNYQKALTYYQKAFDTRANFVSTPDSNLASFLRSISENHLWLKQEKEALSTIQQAFTYLFPHFKYSSPHDNPEIKKIKESQTLLSILQLKAKILLTQYGFNNQEAKNLKAAFEVLEMCIKVTDWIKTDYQTDQSTLVFLSTPEVNQTFILGIQTAIAIKSFQNAFLFCEKAKANVILASIQENFSKTAANIPTALLDKEISLKAQLTFLEKQIAQEEAKGKEQRENILLQWKSQFFDLHQEYLQLIQQFEQDYPDYYQLKYETQTVSIESLQQNLTDNQVMVNYFVGENHYYLFLISSNDFEVHDFEKPEHFEALVEGFLEAVHEHQLEEYAAKAYELYQYLLQPVEHHLMDSFAMFGDLEEAENEDGLEEAKPKELIIIPHGILSYLPFEALLCSALEDSIEGKLEEYENAYHHLDYLLLHCEVSYHYSATLWHYLSNVRGERAEAEHDFVGFAPVYESTLVANEREIGGFAPVYQSEAGRERACPEVSGSEQRDKNEKAVIEEAWKIAAKEVGQWATRSEALRSDGTWTPLPHSKVEAEQIAHLFEQKGLKTQTFLHEQATKEQFQEVVENSRFLLIAAHGVVNDAQPKLSGLVFYPEMREKRIETRDEREVENSPSFVKHGDIWNDTRKMSPNLTGVGESSQTDCILSMEETYHLDLKADLVVLSSCESGIGELAKGEGMMAVNRGFLYAGAKNVVSTLFKVYDKPSSLLTQYLFEGVLEGKGYTAALREAKLRLLKQEEVDVKSWSGFVLIGGKG